jgi:NADH-quinone oxidoreductase subunit J
VKTGYESLPEMTVSFYIAAAIAIAATTLAITRANVVHALLYFICSLLATGIMFLVLGAPFVAALVVIINAGAIMVLFVFVIMMLNVEPQSERRGRDARPLRVWIGPVVLGGVLLGELVYCLFAYGRGATSGTSVGPEWTGLALFGPYVLGVELASMLLLAGLLGAYHLGRGAIKATWKGESS